MLSTPEDISSRRKKRSRPQIVQKVNAGEEDKWSGLGYRVDVSKSNRRTSYMVYDKPQDELFEDKVWICFSKLNFKYMNSNNNFRIRHTSNPDVDPQQIDVFVADDNVAIVVECKSAKIFDKKTSFQDTLLSISAQKDYITNEIREHFSKPNLSVGFVFVTNNYLINDTDKNVAKDKNIIMLNQDDIEYYNSLIKNIGEAAKFHVLADIFEKRPIESMHVEVPAIKGFYDGYTMYTFLIAPVQLLPISFVVHRRKNSKATNTTYQRMIKKSRIDNIRNYIVKEHGFFPNSIIVNIDSDSMTFTEEKKQSDCVSSGTLILPNQYKTAWIIDGQHRLFSYCGTEEASTSFIPVVAFKQLSYKKQSEIFIDINSKQNRVDKNLLLEINSESHWDSEKPEEWLDALISKCILKMSRDQINPLYMRLKSTTEETGGDLTITSLTSALIKTALFGQIISGNLQYGFLSSTKEDIKENTLERGFTILTGYFHVLSTIAETHWKKKGGKEKGYLCTNNGITALIIVLRDILKFVDENDDKLANVSNKDVVEKIKPYAIVIANYFKEHDGEKEIDVFRNQLGAHGQQQSAMDIEVIINETYPEFTSSDLERHKEKTKKQWEDLTKAAFPQLKNQVIETLIIALKKQYGDNTSGWWKKGVPEDVRIEIGKIRESDDEERDYEFYIQLKHVKQIVSSKDWSLFKKYFGFQTYGRKREDQISWLDELERIEKLISGNGRITQDEYNRLQEIRVLFTNKLSDLELFNGNETIDVPPTPPI